MSNFFKRKKTKKQSGFGSSRSFSGRPGGRGKRPIKKFDPSRFIKKVEEYVQSPVYVPENTFADFQIEPKIKENIIKKGYKIPTPIQDQIIPVILQGKDVIGTAETGTGKTAAFLIPLVHLLITGKVKKILIVAPTRELAEQIQSELKTFISTTGINTAVCIGGVSMNLQIRDLKKDPEFVIGTPGRLMDLYSNKLINFYDFDAIVLDEVDRMLDMGFINDIKFIISKLPKKRHSLFFSATISKPIQQIMDQFLQDPVSVNVKKRESSENVNQEIVKVTIQNKIDVLHDFLIKPELKKVIIFVRTKRAADKLSRTLVDRGFKVVVMHGDKTQAQRKKALAAFKDNKVKILLATDVVARGIDINDVTHVINYDLPETHEDYIHRIGRTGRAGKVGQAISFVEG